MRNHQNPSPSRIFYPALDGIRAIAFLMVFFQHYASLPWGWAGVNIFFVLSGFLITGILFDSQNDPHRARNFYIRRSLRIFPLYYCVFLLVLVFNPVFHWRWSAYWLAWPLYLANFLAYISPAVAIEGSPLQLAAWAWLRTPHFPGLILYLGHFWSLCVEEQFYFAWPWIVFFVRSKRALILLCGFIVVFMPFARIIVQHTAPAWMLRAALLDRATPFQLDSLLLGALVALLVRGPLRPALAQAGKMVALALAVAAAFVLVPGVLHSYPNWFGAYTYPSWQYTWGLTFINFFAAGIILAVLEPRGLLFRVLNLQPLRWIGRISYGAYVIHGIFGRIYWAVITAAADESQFVARHFTSFYCLLGLACTLVLSWISFECLEKRFLNLKERWTIQRESAADDASSSPVIATSPSI
jgi:peptidoglycan/LPS O-acetylase OafA/YrhL